MDQHKTDITKSSCITDKKCRRGPRGCRGPEGPLGPPGIPGSVGPTGPTGASGSTGPTGPSGNDGLVGPTGPSGSNGSVGPTGPTGNDGLVGPTGPTGSNGSVGPTGPTGNDGSIGPTGPTGAPGSNLGYVCTDVANNTSGPTGFNTGDIVYNQYVNQRFYKVAGGASQDGGISIIGSAFDSEDNVYVTGLVSNPIFGSVVDFSGQPVPINGTPSINPISNIFIAKLDRNGNQQFFKTAGSINSNAGTSINTVVVGSDNMIYVGGSISNGNPLDFNGDSLGVIRDSSIFVAKLDNTGNQIYFKIAGVSTVTSVIGIENGEVYVAGEYSGPNPTNFDGTIVPSYGATDMYVAKLNENGDQVFFKVAGSKVTGPFTGIDSIRGMTIGFNNSVYITGDIYTGAGSDPVDFNGNPVIGYGITDIFVAKFDTIGTQVFFKVAGSSSVDEGYSITQSLTTLGDNIYVTGRINVTDGKDFNGDPVMGYGTSDNAFVARLDSSGNQIFFVLAGGNAPDKGMSVSSVVIDDKTYVYVTGNINKDGRDFGNTPISGYGTNDIFVAKLDDTGNQIFFKVSGTIGGANEGLYVSGVVNNDNDSVYVTGFINTLPANDPKDFEDNSLFVNTKNGPSTFVAKLNSVGKQEYYKLTGNTTNTVPISLVVNKKNNNVYVTGAIFSNASGEPKDFNNNTITGYGNDDIFVALLTDTKRIIGIAKEMTTGGVTKTIVVGEVPQVILGGLLPNQIYYVDFSKVIPSLTVDETSYEIGVTDNNGKLIIS